MRCARSSGAPATMAMVTTHVVDVGADERRRGDAEVGPEAGGRQECSQLAGSGIAGPKGLSPRRVTRCA